MTDTRGSAEAAYRPHLDGLRAVAVYLVVLFHAGSRAFPGGYVGVDVFFVLSGFLVTQLLLRDIVALDSIRFGRFYARRFRRLLPAAFVALTVTAVVYTAIASPAEVSTTVGSFKAAFLYSTNWYFIHQATGYFGADINTNPVLHFWSLAVEEQFYLLWPLTLGGLYALTRRIDPARRLFIIRTAVAVGALASATWALSLRNSNPNRAYYGTDTRAYELLAGAFIALAPVLIATAKQHRRAIRLGTSAAIAAVLVVASSWIHLDAIERGIVITITTGLLIVALEASEHSAAKRLLSTRTAVYLGKISYGTYLWHWLVILVVLRTFHTSTISTVGIAAFVASALAALSYELLEHPVRTSRLLDRHRRVVIGTGLAVSIVAALVLIPAIVEPAHANAPTIESSVTTGFTPIPANLDWKDATASNENFHNCLGKPASRCTIMHGTGAHVLLLGDSHAQMLLPALEAIAGKEHLTLSVAVSGACPWQRGLYINQVGAFGATGSCKAVKEDIYNRVIPKLHPDIIIVMNLGYEDPVLGFYPFLDQSGRLANTSDPNGWPETTTLRSLAELRADNRKVLIIEPIPIAPPKLIPKNCLSAAKVLEECRYVAMTSPDPLARTYRELDQQYDNVWAADFDRLVCPFLPICDPVVNGQIVKGDRTHLTHKFALTLAGPIDNYLKQTGIISR